MPYTHPNTNKVKMHGKITLCYWLSARESKPVAALY